MPKLIMMDIDGTLLTEDKKFLPFTRSVLQVLHQKGVLLGLASGKPHFQIRYFADEWQLGFPFDVVIGMNGSEVYVEKEHQLYNYDCLSKDELKEITEILFDAEGGNLFIYLDEWMIYQNDSESSRLSSIRNRIPYKVINDPSDYWQRENAKILDRFHTIEQADYAASLLHCDDKNYYCFKTQPTLLEIAPKTVNKVNALRMFCEKENISLKDVWTFGDMDNDAEMLKAAGTGICLINGAEIAKQAADQLTDFDNDHEGLAHYINDHLKML